MRGVHYSACSLCYKKIAQFHQKCSLIRDCSLFRHLLLPEYTVDGVINHVTNLPKYIFFCYFSNFIAPCPLGYQINNQINKDLNGLYCCKIKIDGVTCDGFKYYHPNLKRSKCCKSCTLESGCFENSVGK